MILPSTEKGFEMKNTKSLVAVVALIVSASTAFAVSPAVETSGASEVKASAPAATKAKKPVQPTAKKVATPKKVSSQANTQEVAELSIAEMMNYDK